MSVVKNFNVKTLGDVKDHSGTSIVLDWSVVTPALTKLVNLRDDETLDGFITYGDK